MEPTTLPIVAAFANLSAVGILGYWLVFGLPATLTSIGQSHERSMVALLAAQSEERRQWGERLCSLAESLDRLGQAIPTICRQDMRPDGPHRLRPPS